MSAGKQGTPEKRAAPWCCLNKGRMTEDCVAVCSLFSSEECFVPHQHIPQLAGPHAAVSRLALQRHTAATAAIVFVFAGDSATLTFNHCSDQKEVIIFTKRRHGRLHKVDVYKRFRMHNSKLQLLCASSKLMWTALSTN